MRTRTTALCHADAAREMLERELPRYTCGGCGATFASKGQKRRHKAECHESAVGYRMGLHITPRIAQIAAAEWDALPEGAFRPLQDARAHLASLSPERRAELDKEWNDA